MSKVTQVLAIFDNGEFVVLQKNAKEFQAIAELLKD